MGSNAGPAVGEGESGPPSEAGSGTADEPGDSDDEALIDGVASRSDPLPLDVLFGVLKNERRRRILDLLEERDEPMEIGDIAEAIAAQENDTTVDGITPAERKRVYVGLYQSHLPKMDQLGIVRFDRRQGQVELGENADQLAPYRDAGAGPRRPWYRYYTAIAGVGVGLYGAGVVGLLPLQTAVPYILGIVLAALLGCAVAHAAAVRATGD